MNIDNRGQNSTSTILAVIGVILLGALVWWAFTQYEAPTQEPAEDGTVQDGQPLPVPGDWQTLRSEQLNFSIKYPPQVMLNQATAGRVEFSLVGPGSTPGSEITDGILLTVANENLSGFASLEEYVTAQYQEMSGGNLGIQPPQPTTFHDRSAYAFVVRSQLGITVEHLYVAHDAGTALHVSWSVEDPNEQGYASIIDTMLFTLDLDVTDQADVALFTRVRLAVLDTEPEGDADRGCDDVAFIERDSISPTTQPLNAALTQLFLLQDEQVDGYLNFIARTNDTLSFERATVEAGTASIFLSGSLTGLAGVCDDPRARIQIEETALRFSTVDNVRIFLNGQETDLQPSQQ